MSLFDEDSDDSSNGFLSRSLSLWKGAFKETASNEQIYFEPIKLDIYTAASIGEYDCVFNYVNTKKLSILNKKNKGGWTALMYAAYTGHESIVTMLINGDVALNVGDDKRGRTALMLAASCGNESIAYFLIQAGCEMETRDYQGWTAIYHATSSGHQNMVLYLIESGCDINVKIPKTGFTPLMEAAFAGHEIIIQHLLRLGVKVNEKNNQGETARSLAMLEGHTKIVSLIDNVTILTEEANVRKSPIVKELSVHYGPQAFSQLMSKTTPTNSMNSGVMYQAQSVSVPSAPARSNNSPSTTTANSVGALLPGIHDPQLAVLLDSLSLSKYLTVFDEQDVDLQVFLSLTDHDLKEIGIKLFGPRRKMTNAIARFHGNNRNFNGNQIEQAYADKMEAEMQEMALQLHKSLEDQQHLSKKLEAASQNAEQLVSRLASQNETIVQFSVLTADIVNNCNRTVTFMNTSRQYIKSLQMRYKYPHVKNFSEIQLTGLDKNELEQRKMLDSQNIETLEMCLMRCNVDIEQSMTRIRLNIEDLARYVPRQDS